MQTKIPLLMANVLQMAFRVLGGRIAATHVCQHLSAGNPEIRG
jgi:hypothetical protein